MCEMKGLAVSRILLFLLYLVRAIHMMFGLGTRPSQVDDDVTRYCRICTSHTMCRFQFETSGEKCFDVDSYDFDDYEISFIVEQHNLYRSKIVRALEQRGNPGPQPSAKYMMKLEWDEELAEIARRWVLQCNLFEKDTCRDVERFSVEQNVQVLDLDEVGSGPALSRISFHIQSWSDEVEQFDAAEVGLVDSESHKQSSYIALASASIEFIGCGRASYIVNLSDTDDKYVVLSNCKSSNRVQVLVCNYGPIDRTSPQRLYEIGAPGSCPNGTSPCTKYEGLCSRVLQKKSTQSRSFVEKYEDEKEEDIKNMENVSFSTVPNSSFLIFLVLEILII